MLFWKQPAMAPRCGPDTDRPFVLVFLCWTGCETGNLGCLHALVLVQQEVC